MLQKTLNARRAFSPVSAGCAGLLFLLGGVNVASGEETRHAAAHEHGAAQLNIAQDGRVITAEFVSPAINLVGFEHMARDADEEKAVRDAIALLEDGGSLFRFKGTECALESALVKAEGLLAPVSGEARHADEHEHEHEDEQHDTHASEHDGEHADEEGHSEFEATYRFNCQSEDMPESIRIGFFDKWLELEDVDTVFLGSGKQLSAELTSWVPTLEIED